MSDKELLRKAKTAVYRMLKIRPRSEKEIVDKLRQKSFSDSLIDPLLVELKAAGLINDADFARGWTRSRLNKPFGLVRIRQELREKGIDAETLETAVAQAAQDYDETAAVLKLGRQRLRQYQGLERTAAQRRLFGYLARRGFKSGTAAKAVRELI
jgi:regulatory protein